MFSFHLPFVRSPSELAVTFGQVLPTLGEPKHRLNAVAKRAETHPSRVRLSICFENRGYAVASNERLEIVATAQWSADPSKNRQRNAHHRQDDSQRVEDGDVEDDTQNQQ